MDVIGIIRVSDQGMTNPILCRAEDSEVYCCKGVHTGISALRAEWMCANIAKVLSLPVPPFAIHKVPYELFKAWQSDQTGHPDQLVTPENPYVFGSRMMRNVKDVLDANGLSKVADRVLMARILMFDRMIRNMDRSELNSNLLMCVKGDAQCYIIDHNLAFDREYNDVEFMRNHILRDYYSGVGDAVKRDFFDDVRQCVNDEFLEKTWYLMPSQWLDEEYDKTSVTLDEIKAIISQEVENGRS